MRESILHAEARRTQWADTEESSLGTRRFNCLIETDTLLPGVVVRGPQNVLMAEAAE
jgi:hypothetical protein